MKIQGIVPPMATPFREDESIDEALLRAEVEYLIGSAGAHGLAVGGSTGEGHTLTTDELRCVVGDRSRDGRVTISPAYLDSTGSARSAGPGRPRCRRPASDAGALSLPPF